MDFKAERLCRYEVFAVALIGFGWLYPVEGASGGGLSVTEIMFHPEAGQPEWIELRNDSTAEIVLREMTLLDATGRGSPVTEEIVLAPGALAVLTEDGELLLTEHPELDPAMVHEPAGRWPRLNDSGDGAGGWTDCVILRHVRGSLLDRVCYRGSWVRAAGCSIERVGGGSGGGAAWFSGVQGGTPGRENFWREVPAAAPPLKVDPSVLTLRAGSSRPVRIAYSLSDDPRWIALELRDLGGKLLSTIVKRSRAPGRGELCWEPDGGRLPSAPGVFVVVLHSFSGRGERTVLVPLVINVER